MAKPTSRYVCQECGAVFSKWAGKCGECGVWDSIVEERPVALSAKKTAGGGNEINFHDLTLTTKQPIRTATHIEEFDRVLGGGLVKASAILIGGDPGIGKSTLLLQSLASLAYNGASCVYISGEESIEQIQLRARRLGLADAPIKLATSTSTADISATLDKIGTADVVVIDSIQTLFVDDYSSAPGTVSQVRASAHELIRIAKERGFSLFLVGHVTKEGQIAGPKVLEHMVDTVLYFEGERGHQFRILRAVKNRFGPANEIGVFEMQEKGLVEVSNPSALFLGEREGDISGTSVFAGMEGTRPVLVEIQALVAPSQLATPRRAVVGWDANRLAMILAVLATRFGLRVGDKEVYLNVAGGLKIGEPAADLAVAVALISAASNIPVPKECVVFGEIGLAGEVRMVSQPQLRLKEAAKLGFTSAIMPRTTAETTMSGMVVSSIRHIRELRGLFAPSARQKEMEGVE